MTTPPGSDPTAPDPFRKYDGPPPPGVAPQQPYGQQPYGQQPYGQQPYGQQQPYVGPPAYGYADPPPAWGGGAPHGPDAGWQAWGGPATPPGLILVPGHPPMQAATPGQRSLGRLIDSAGYAVLLAGAITAIVLVFQHSTSTQVVGRYGYPQSSGDGLAVLGLYGILFAYWLVIVGYESLMIGLTGATVGDRLMGVRFVRAKDGGPPGLARGLGRAGFLGVSFAGCYGLAFLLMLFSMFFDGSSGRYQSWPDKIFGLQAVSTKG